MYFICDSWYNGIMDKEAALKDIVAACRAPQFAWKMVVIKPEPWNVTDTIYRAYHASGEPMYMGEYTVEALKRRVTEQLTQYGKIEFHVVKKELPTPVYTTASGEKKPIPPVRQPWQGFTKEELEEEV